MRYVVATLGIVAVLIVVSCSDSEGCPGIVCSNCATTCNITCNAGETEVCIGHGPVDKATGKQPQRCAYCKKN
jgi:hypothetical protein